MRVALWIALACCSGRATAPPAVSPTVLPPIAPASPFVHHDRFPATGEIHATWTIARDDVWAVGAEGTILHWDGRSWSVAYPACRMCLPYRAVWASGPRDVWVVGATSAYYHHGDGHHPTHSPPHNRVLHWDGLAWANVPLPPLGAEMLQGVHGSGPDDVWFTTTSSSGRLRRSENPTTAVLHWDGKRMELHTIPDANAVRSVWSLGKRDAWMLANTLTRNLVLHWNGTAWTEQFAVKQATALWGSGGEIWISTATKLRRRDRKGVWSATPLDRVYRVFRDATPWATGPSGLWRWAGTRFEQIAVPTSFAVEAAGGEWMFGKRGERRTAIRGTTTLDDHPKGIVRSPSFSAADAGWAVSSSFDEQGRLAGHELVRWNGTAWRGVMKPPIPPRAVWATTGGKVWIAGGGDIAIGDGDTWTVMPRLANTEYTSLWGTGPDDLWAAGCGGSLAHWDGTSWSKVAIDVPPEHGGICLALGGSGANDVWAVAQQDNIFHWDGRAWNRVTLDPKLFATRDGFSDRAEPNAVWAAAPDDVWMVGGASVVDSMLIAHFDGTQWTRVAIEPEPEPMRESHQVPPDVDRRDLSRSLWAIWGRGPRDVWAAGERGIVMHFDGTRWSRVVTPPHDTRYVAGIAGTPTATWFTGQNGTIISLAHGAAFEISTPPKLACITPPASAATWWLEGDAGCPPGAILEGTLLSKDREVWCRKPFGDRHGPAVKFFKSGTPSIQRSYVDGMPMGVVTRWNVQGVKTEEAGRCGRIAHGPLRRWSDTGQQLLDATMVDGAPDGVIRAWDTNGRPLGTSTITAGTGHMTWWSDDGTKASEGDYKDGKQHGEWIEYWGGKRYLRGSYVAGKREGEWIEWDQTGHEQSRIEYRDGKPK